MEPAPQPSPRPFAGALFALGAYGTWGLVAVYWRALGPVPALEVLAHRVLGSVVIATGLLAAASGFPALGRTLRDRRRLALLAASTVILSANWGLFIWAVQAGRLVDASLGYYINPLVNVALGVIVLGERLRRWQGVAVALASAGVLYLAWRHGSVPWVSLGLAVTFGVYGLLRKIAPVDVLTGFFAETALLTPVALAYVVPRELAGVGALAKGDPHHDVLLAAAGLVTAVPLLCFTAAARRLPLTTLGFFQYLSPSLQLLLAVRVFGEAFTRDHAVTFALIWAALAMYSGEAFWHRGSRPGR